MKTYNILLIALALIVVCALTRQQTTQSYTGMRHQHNLFGSSVGLYSNRCPQDQYGVNGYCVQDNPNTIAGMCHSAGDGSIMKPIVRCSVPTSVANCPPGSIYCQTGTTSSGEGYGVCQSPDQGCPFVNG